jgi:hypothetical protein
MWYDAGGPFYRTEKRGLLIYDSPGPETDAQAEASSEKGKEFDYMEMVFHDVVAYAGLPIYRVQWARVFQRGGQGKWEKSYPIDKIKGQGAGGQTVPLKGDGNLPKVIRDMMQGDVIKGGNMFLDKECTKPYPDLNNLIVKKGRAD